MRALSFVTTCVVSLCAASVASALPKYLDWARLPASGAAVPGAFVTVLDADGGTAVIYRDAAGTLPSPNPLTADAAGYFQFFGRSGEYEVRVATATGELYRLPHVLLIDPDGPQSIHASASEPALTLAQVAADAPVHSRLATTSLRIERRTPEGMLETVPG